MILAQMRFNGFTWFHNPKQLEIEDDKNVYEKSSPYVGSHTQNFGRRCRIVKGVGELYGEDCLKQYEKLYSLFLCNKSGVLSLPDIPPMNAHFEKLSVVESTLPDVITYKFVFREENNFSDDSVTKFHKVCEGETLWDIAYKYGFSVSELVILNPDIKRPDKLLVGESVRLC